MFKISVAAPPQLAAVAQYLGFLPKGLAMVCVEDGEMTGACAFDIAGGSGVLQSVKADKPEMEPVLAAAALNFLDLHGIRRVYSNLQEQKAIHKLLGFRPCEGQAPIKPAGGYLVCLNLEGYFDGDSCGRCASQG